MLKKSILLIYRNHIQQLCHPFGKNFSTLIFRDFSESIKQCVTQTRSVRAVDVNRVRWQHKQIVNSASKASQFYHILEQYPQTAESIFVEDTAIIIDGLAIILQPGERARELIDVKEKLIEIFSSENIHEVEPIDEQGEHLRISGRDVLWTGRHLLIKVSERTNQRGAERLALYVNQKFPDIKVILMPEIQNQKNSSLKDLITRLTDRVLIIQESNEGQAIQKLIDKQLAGSYDFIKIPKDLQNASNVLAIPDIDRLRFKKLFVKDCDFTELIVKKHLKLFSQNGFFRNENYGSLSEKVQRVQIDEINRCGGSLTSMCIISF